MSHIEEARFDRTCMIVLRICPSTLRKVIDEHCTRNGPITLVDLLEKNKHALFHQLQKRCCCQRRYSGTAPGPVNRFSWELLYIKNSSSCQTSRDRREECPCQYDAKIGITTGDMDVTLCCYVIHNMCPGVNMSHIETIRDIRNKLIHRSNTSLNEKTYYEYWNKVKTAITDLANGVSKMQYRLTLDNMNELENRVLNFHELGELRKLIVDQKRIEDLEEMTKDHGKMAEDVKQTTERVTQIEGKVDNMTEKMLNLEGSMEKMSQPVTQKERNTDQATQIVTKLKGGLDRLKQKVEGSIEMSTKNTIKLEGRMEQMTQTVTKLEEGLDLMTHKIEGRIETTTKNTTQLEGKMDQMTQTVTKLEGRLDQLTSKMEGSIETTTNNTTKLEEWMNLMTLTVTKLGRRMDQITQTVTKLEGRLDQLTNKSRRKYRDDDQEHNKLRRKNDLPTQTVTKIDGIVHQSTVTMLEENYQMTQNTDAHMKSHKENSMDKTNVTDIKGRDYQMSRNLLVVTEPFYKYKHDVTNQKREGESEIEYVIER